MYTLRTTYKYKYTLRVSCIRKVLYCTEYFLHALCISSDALPCCKHHELCVCSMNIDHYLKYHIYKKVSTKAEGKS